MLAPSRRLLCGIAALLLASPAFAQADTALRGVIDLAAVRAAAPRPVAPLGECPAAPDPIRDINKPIFYTDAAQSVRDPALWAEANRVLEPMKLFGRGLARMSDEYAMDPAADPARARCVGQWLLAWARAGAMLGTVSTWGSSDRIWFVVINASTALLKIDPADALDPAERREVADWLAAVMRASIAQNDINYRRIRNTPAYGNNQVAWAAAGAMITAVAAQDRALFDRGVADLEAALDRVGPDGLNADARRGGRALSYLAFGLGPMTLAVAYAEANDVPVLQRNDRAFERLWLTTIGLLRDPSALVQRTHAEQVAGGADRPRPGIPFVPLAAQLTHNAEIERYAADERPGFSDTLGGDLQHLYAAAP